MQTDDVIWALINHGFCTFKVKSGSQTFCRNEYNLTGLCSRQSCPLGNSRYATVREHDGAIYLYIKTIERAHLPNRMWERVKLSRNYEKALKQIDTHLAYWSKFIIHRCKQRLTRITQYLLRMRRLRSRKTDKLIPISRRVEKLEERKEERALTVARIDKSIEKELLTRLEKGTYGEIYNFPENEFQKAIETIEKETPPSQELNSESDSESSQIEYVEDDELSESEVSDIEETQASDSKTKTINRSDNKRLQIEYELEQNVISSNKNKKIKITN